MSWRSTALALSSALELAAQTVRGRVVDADGKGVAGVEVTYAWCVSPPRFEPPTRPTLSDAEGWFPITWAKPHPYAVVGFTAGREAGFAVVAQPGAEQVVCELRPTVRWRARLQCSALGLSKVGEATYVRDEGGTVNVGYVLEQEGGDLDLLLPAGKWLLCGNGGRYGELARLRLPVVLDGAKREVATMVDIPAAPWAMLQGHAFPEWQVKPARASDPAAKIGDFQGRWLLVAFLDHETLDLYSVLPRLVEVHEEESLRETLATVAVFWRAASFVDVARRIAAWEPRHGPMPMPLPVLIDDGGATAAQLGIDVSPTLLLVQPDGRLWGLATVDEAIAAARGELPMRPPRRPRAAAPAEPDEEWDALPVRDGFRPLLADRLDVRELLRSRACNWLDGYLPRSKRRELGGLLAEAEVPRLWQAYMQAVGEAVQAGIADGSIVPATEELLTADERATLRRRAGDDPAARRDWAERLLRGRRPALRWTHSGGTTYFWSPDELTVVHPQRDAWRRAFDARNRRVLDWFRDAGVLPPIERAIVEHRLRAWCDGAHGRTAPGGG